MSNLVLTEAWIDTRKSRSIFQYISYEHVGTFAAICDFALILAASIASGVVYHFFVFQMDGDVDAFVAVGCYSGLIFVLLSKLFGVYQPDALLSTSSQVRGVVAVWGAVLLFVTSLFFLLKIGSSYSEAQRLASTFLVSE